MPQHSHQLICDDSAPRLARAWVRLMLLRVRPPDGFSRGGIVQDVVLCASELVTSSMIANSTAMTLRLSTEPGLFRLSLLDDSPILTNSGDSRLHVQSMSFRLIEASSDASGISPASPGRELWALFREDEPAETP